MTARTYAGALSDLTVAMIDAHERTCEIEGGHPWDRCTSTPSVYGVADALDLLTAQPGDELPVTLVPAVARLLHNRECQQSECGPWDADAVDGHVDAWRDQASALLVHASFTRTHAHDAPPVPDARSGELLTRCVCGHIRRGHSVDGSRCYSSPCTCQPDGGFRPVPTGQ